MAEYECPQCNGGFPEPKPTENGPECPWCGVKLNGERDFPGGGSILNPPDLGGSIDTVDTTPFGGGGSSTTPCPECGEPMPMVTWTGQKPTCRKCSRAARNKLGGNTTHQSRGESE